MNLTLYTSTSDKNRIDKTSFLTTLITLSGTMKTESSIINPIIAIDLSQESVIVDDDSLEVASDGKSIIGDTLTNLLKANYAYILDFNRYYFITNIVQVTTFILRFELACDCLMSYQEEIYSLEALVTRNETTFDPLMEDTNNQLSFKKEVTYNEDIFGDLVNFHFKTLLTEPSIALTTITDKVQYSPGTILAPRGTGLPDIAFNDFSTTSSTSVIYAFDSVYTGALCKHVYNNDTAMTFVKSVIAYPFELETREETTNVYIGDTRLLTDTEFPITQKLVSAVGSPYKILADFIVPEASSYLDYNPYKHIELFIPYHGYVELDTQKLGGHHVILFYSVSYEDGSATANIYDITTKTIIFTTAVNLGVKLSLSSTNLLENNTAKTANGTNLAIGLVASALSIGAGIATYNPMAIAGGVLAGVKTTANFINSNAMIFDKAQVSFSDPTTALYSRLTPFLRITSSVPQITSGYNRLFGRPLYKVKKLEDMKGTGFTIVSNYRLDGISGITSPEMDNLSTYLENGVIL